MDIWSNETKLRMAWYGDIEDACMLMIASHRDAVVKDDMMTKPEDSQVVWRVIRFMY